MSGSGRLSRLGLAVACGMCLGIPTVLHAQAPPTRADVAALHARSLALTARFATEHAAAVQWAKRHGIENLRRTQADGSVSQLMTLVDGRPVFYLTDNANAADTVSADEIQVGGATGLDLDGDGVALHIWDSGAVRITHQELVDRVTLGQFAPTSNHSTHVAGTMVASGVNASARGMAPLATLRSFDFFNDDAEMASEAAVALVSNHSYGLITGWIFGDFGLGTGADWHWFGDVTLSTVEDPGFGRYSNGARNWDQIAFDAPSYLIVKSAGNDRNDFGPTAGTEHWHLQSGAFVQSTDSHPGDGFPGGFDSISWAGNAKNILTVGAVFDINGGYAGPASVNVVSFSSWGPSDDGRIKPDIVANGVTLFSSSSSSDTAYTSLSGTSMSSPNAAGTMGLLVQHYRITHGGDDPRSATLKGVVIHTADEAGGAPGPDYSHGWGLLNAQAAADRIEQDVANPEVIQQLRLDQGTTFEQIVTYNGDGPLKATICWTDPAGSTAPFEVDPSHVALVNDLDLRVIGSAGEFLPWVLDGANPTNPATTGDNNRDNVEVIVIDAPDAGDYTIRITHKGTLANGGQDFTLILSGTDTQTTSGGCCQASGTVCSIGSSVDCAQLGGSYQGGGTVCLGDGDGNGLDDLCGCLLAAVPTEAGCCPDGGNGASSRFLSFRAGSPGATGAVRVTFLSLPAPFSIFNGTTMWVGEPRAVSEKGGLTDDTPPTFQAATLECDPLSLDWNALGDVSVYHRLIVPGGVYQVDALDDSCVVAPGNFSNPLVVVTARWGDVVGLFNAGTAKWSAPNGVVEVTADVVAVLDRFASLPNSPSKVRADVQPDTPDLVITITDVTRVLDAFSGVAFPYAPGESPCPLP